MSDDYYDWDVPDHWSDDEAEMWEDFVEIDPRLGDDDYAQILFNEAYFDMDVAPGERDAIAEALAAYLDSVYDIDFADTFDWEDYREWYAST